MINIDFFGCSFTQFANYPYQPPKGRMDLELYSMHSQNTKTLSSFLDFDLAYNNNSDYQINNYGRGSYGNFTICNVIENKTKTINKKDTNIAVVQLSAILRNEQSWETIKHDSKISNLSDVFNIDFDRVKPDYIVEDKSIGNFYEKHINNLKNIINLLKENYTKFIIFFGWDIFTPEFYALFRISTLNTIIPLYNYEYKLTSTQYFENIKNYNSSTKIYKGISGGMLEYASNKLDNQLFRYVSEVDHHPSYFSNKIFYTDVVREFLKDNTNLHFDKNYFLENNIIQFENFLQNLLIKKSIGNEWENYNYSDLQKEIILHIRNNIFNKKT